MAGGIVHALGGTIVTCCNVKPSCKVQFRSASDKSVIAAQLEAASWSVKRNKHGVTYLCPAHAVTTSLSMSPVPPDVAKGSR